MSNLFAGSFLFPVFHWSKSALRAVNFSALLDILSDPSSQLPGKSELQVSLDRIWALEQSRITKYSSKTSVMKHVVLVRSGCHNKVPQNGRVQVIDIYFP